MGCFRHIESLSGIVWSYFEGHWMREVGGLRTSGKDMFGGGTIVMTDEVVTMDVMTQRQSVEAEGGGGGE